MVAVKKISDVPLVEEIIRKFEHIEGKTLFIGGMKFWEKEPPKEQYAWYATHYQLGNIVDHHNLTINKSLRIEMELVEFKLDATIRTISGIHFGKDYEATEGCQYLRKNLIGIVRDFFNEMDIEHPLKPVEISFAVLRNMLVEKDCVGFYDGAINERENMITIKFNIMDITMAEDFDEIETKILERYQVPYAIPIRVTYNGTKRF